MSGVRVSLLPPIQTKINSIMYQHYITSDKIGEFVSAMYKKGIRVDVNPLNSELSFQLPTKEYRWIKILSESSYDEVYESIINEINESHE